MKANNFDEAELDKWDPAFIKQVVKFTAPIFEQHFRSEVKGMDALPRTGGALVVCNHSG